MYLLIKNVRTKIVVRIVLAITVESQYNCTKLKAIRITVILRLGYIIIITIVLLKE